MRTGVNRCGVDEEGGEGDGRGGGFNGEKRGVEGKAFIKIGKVFLSERTSVSKVRGRGVWFKVSLDPK